MSEQHPAQDPQQSPQDPAPTFGQSEPPSAPSYGQPTYGQGGFGEPSNQQQAQQPFQQQPFQQQGQQHYPAYAAPARPMSPEDERTWGALSHGAAVIAMVLSAGFLGFLGSLAVYLVHKDRGPFVRAHAANSLNVQITMAIWLVVAFVLYIILSIVTLGIGLVVFWPIFFVPVIAAGILHIIGTLKAYNGEWWDPPLTARFIR